MSVSSAIEELLRSHLVADHFTGLGDLRFDEPCYGMKSRNQSNDLIEKILRVIIAPDVRALVSDGGKELRLQMFVEESERGARQPDAGTRRLRGRRRHPTAAARPFGSKIALSTCSTSLRTLVLLTPGPHYRPAWMCSGSAPTAGSRKPGERQYTDRRSSKSRLV